MTHTKDFRACALVPCYNHAQAVRTVLTRLTGMGLEVVLVDDGSNPDQARQLDAIVPAASPSFTARPTAAREPRASRAFEKP